MDTCFFLSHTLSLPPSPRTHFLNPCLQFWPPSTPPRALISQALVLSQLDRHSGLGTQLPASRPPSSSPQPPSLPPVSFHPSIHLSICPFIHSHIHPSTPTHPPFFPSIYLAFIPQCPEHLPYVTLCARYLISHLPKLQIHSPDGLQECPIAPRLSPRFLSSAHSGATQTTFCLLLPPSLHSSHPHSGSGPLGFSRTSPAVPSPDPILSLYSTARSAHAPSCPLLPPPAPREHALPFNCHPTGRVPTLPVHLCLVPASALPWLIFLEQPQELAKLRRRSSLPEDEGDGKEYSLSRWSPGWGWLCGGPLGSRVWGGTAGVGQALGPAVLVRL